MLTYTWHQHPRVRRTGGSSNGLRKSFSCVNTTGEQVFFVAFIPPSKQNPRKTNSGNPCKCIKMLQILGWTLWLFISHHRSGFMRFSPAKLTAPSHGGRPWDSSSPCRSREEETKMFRSPSLISVLQTIRHQLQYDVSLTVMNQQVLKWALGLPFYFVLTLGHTHVIFPGPGWRDISVTSWPLSLSRRVSSRPTKPDPPPTRNTTDREIIKRNKLKNKSRTLPPT